MVRIVVQPDWQYTSDAVRVELGHRLNQRPAIVAVDVGGPVLPCVIQTDYFYQLGRQINGLEAD